MPLNLDMNVLIFLYLLALTSKYKELHDLLHYLWHTNHQRHNTMHLLIIAPNSSPTQRRRPFDSKGSHIWKRTKILTFTSKHKKKLYDLLHHLWHTNHLRHNTMHLLIVFIYPGSFFEPTGQAKLPMANTIHKMKNSRDF